MARWKRTPEQIQEDIKSQSKVCCVCEKRKAFADFYNMKNKNDGKSYRCKSCDDAARKKWAANKPESQKRSTRRNRLWTHYRLRPEDYEELLTRQGGVCGICGGTEENTKHLSNLAIDHCHTTGKIRGLLCNKCNRGLGFFSDSLELLTKAVDYLSKHH